MLVNAWEGQILRFTSPDTGQDRWNFADGDLRAPMTAPYPLIGRQIDARAPACEILFDPANGEVSQAIDDRK